MSTYANENDPFVSQWLANLYPDWTIDARSVVEVTPEDVRGFTRCHFFAGIAGWDLALDLAGWPEDRPVWSASLPCQPFSHAGRRRAEEDERHLWPVFLALVAECRPAAIVGEQVASRLGREWLARVRTDLEALGYRVGAADLCAAGVGAPHRRQRLFWVALPGDEAGTDHRLAEPGEGGRAVERAPRVHGDGEAGHHAPGRGSPGRACVGNADGGGGARDAGAASGAEAEAARPRALDGPDGHDALGAGAVERAGREVLRGEWGQPDAPRSGEGGVVVVAERSGLQGHAEHEPRGDQPRRLHALARGSAWAASRLVRGQDGKVRRAPTEPGVQPLAHGVPGRVQLLRAYGNAIVVQIAAAFIEAVIQAEEQ